MPPGDKSDLDRIYEGARDLFLRGEHERALDRFQSIYEVDCTFRDVAEIVDDYYDTAKGEWVAKYDSRFKQQHERA
jgi:hypothetical protein